MTRHAQMFEVDHVVVPIDDDTDTSPAAVEPWLAGLHRVDSVLVSSAVSVTEIAREIREPVAQT